MRKRECLLVKSSLSRQWGFRVVPLIPFSEDTDFLSSATGSPGNEIAGNAGLDADYC